MATWQEVSAVLTSGKVHPGEMVNDSLVKTLIHTTEGRSQLVWVEHVKGNAILSSVVCKKYQVNLAALFKSDILVKVSYGLGSIGEHLTIKHVAPLENMDANELADPLISLAFFGDILEAAITGGDAY